MNPGDKVRIMRRRPGGREEIIGRGIVASVSPTGIVKLVAGTRWRRDGYAWGSRPERGIGRSHQERIEKDGG